MWFNHDNAIKAATEKSRQMRVERFRKMIAKPGIHATYDDCGPSFEQETKAVIGEYLRVVVLDDAGDKKLQALIKKHPVLCQFVATVYSSMNKVMEANITMSKELGRAFGESQGKSGVMKEQRALIEQQEITRNNLINRTLASEKKMDDLTAQLAVANSQLVGRDYEIARLRKMLDEVRGAVREE